MTIRLALVYESYSARPWQPLKTTAEAFPLYTYRVEVGQPGFTTIRTNVLVDVGNVVGLDLRLEVGSSTQTVSVEAAAPILKTKQSSSSAEVAVDAFGELPLSAGGGRSPSSLARR